MNALGRHTTMTAMLATFSLMLLAGCPQSEETSDTPGGATATTTADATDGHDHNHAAPAAGAGDKEVTIREVDADGYAEELAKHKGKVVLVDFWATWCVPCRRDFPHTVEMANEYGDHGLAVISVSMDDPDSKDQAVEFLQKQNATFTNLLSSLGGEEEGMAAFGIESGSLPHYKIYDRNGNLVKTFEQDPDMSWGHEQVHQAVVDLVEAKP